MSTADQKILRTSEDGKYHLYSQDIYGECKQVDDEVSEKIAGLRGFDPSPPRPKWKEGDTINVAIGLPSLQDVKNRPLLEFASALIRNYLGEDTYTEKVQEFAFDVGPTSAPNQPIYPKGFDGVFDRNYNVRNKLDEKVKDNSLNLGDCHLVLILAVENEIYEKGISDKDLRYDRPIFLFYNCFSKLPFCAVGRGPGVQKDLLDIVKDLGCTVTYGNVMKDKFSTEEEPINDKDWHALVCGKTREFFIAELCDFVRKKIGKTGIASDVLPPANTDQARQLATLPSPEPSSDSHISPAAITEVDRTAGPSAVAPAANGETLLHGERQSGVRELSSNDTPQLYPYFPSRRATLKSPFGLSTIRIFESCLAVINMSSSTQYLETTLQKAHENYTSRNPRSATIHQDASQHLPGGNTRTSLYTQPFPLIVASANAKSLTSVDGHTYTDFLSEYSAAVFGHSNPQIAQAVTNALQRGWNYGAENVYEKQLAAKLIDRFGPGGLELVRFTNSGTEANTMAIGAAIAWTGRSKVLVFSGAYHGSTFAFPMEFCRQWWHRNNFTSIDRKDGDEAQAPEIKTLNLPHEFVVAPFNNIPETKHILEKMPDGESLAAILVEPVQGSGGCRPASIEFLQFLRNTADQLGALLVIDEVMTSRLAPSGYFSSLGLKADLLTFGKWIGGGMSFGAFGGRRDIMEMFNPSRGDKDGRLIHPGTYNNNIFTMSAGVVGLEVFNAEKVHDLNAKGDAIKTAITKLLFEAGIYSPSQANFLNDVIEVDSFKGETRLYTGSDPDYEQKSGEPLPPMFISSRGSLLNVRFTGPNAALWHGLYFHYMLEKGIYIASRGFTPLNIELTDADIGSYVTAVHDFIVQHKSELKLAN